MSSVEVPFGNSSCGPNCRHCNSRLTLVMADLGKTPVANDYLPMDADFSAEPYYPLVAYVCSDCRLAQTHDFVQADRLFRADYAYFSSMSKSWLDHARRYVEAMRSRFGLTANSRHVELASNDGYLLQYSKAAGLACLGVEPCQSVAQAATEKGIETRTEFFGLNYAHQLVAEGWSADLITANNVYAHVPDVNDFTAGIAALLAPEGIATIEVQHLLSMMQHHEFDTIYHEHFSYYSLLAAKRIFESQGLRVFDVELLPTHGGSIRFFVCRKDAGHAETPNVATVLDAEIAYGLREDRVYLEWRDAINSTRTGLVEMISSLKAQGKRIAAYGAPAKGNTLLNFCGIGLAMIDFTVDLAPSKQNRMLPGVHIPIYAPEVIMEQKPDFVLILPWNLKGEIKTQLAAIEGWGGRFIVPIPVPTIEA